MIVSLQWMSASDGVNFFRELDRYRPYRNTLVDTKTFAAVRLQASGQTQLKAWKIGPKRHACGHPFFTRFWCASSSKGSPWSVDVRGLLRTLLLARPAPSLADRFPLPVGDARPRGAPPMLALRENSSFGLTFVAVRVVRPDTAIGSDFFS